MADFEPREIFYDALHEEFKVSDGYRIRRDLLAIQQTFYSFEVNFKELDALIRSHFRLKVERKLGDFFDREPLEDLLIEASRRLHNFVFAAQALAQHSRNFVEHWHGSEPSIKTDYITEAQNCFGVSGIGAFTTDLRNFYAHCSSPFLASRSAGSHPTDGEALHSLVLDTVAMSQRREWSKSAKHYIFTHSDHVDLGIYASEYYGVNVRFYQWLSERNAKWCKTAWESTLSLQARLLAGEERWSRRKA